MSPSHGNRNGRRYRYYVSQAVIQGLKYNPDTITKIPAHETEKVICRTLLEWLNNPTWLQTHLQPTSLDQLKLWQTCANQIKQTWDTTSVAVRHLTIRSILQRVVIMPDEVQIWLSKRSILNILNGQEPTGTPDESDLLTFAIAAQVKSLGKEKRLIIQGEISHNNEPNQELIKAISLGHSWRQMLVSGQFTSLKGLAEHLELADTHVARYAQLGLLAPDIIEVILTGNQPLGLTVRKLYALSSTDWPT
jgi:site-specific DNA recombinase